MNEPRMMFVPNVLGLGYVHYETAANEYGTYTQHREYLRTRKRTRMLKQIWPYNKMWESFYSPVDDKEWSDEYARLFQARPHLWVSITLAHEVLTTYVIFRGTPPFRTEVFGNDCYALADNDAQIVQYEVEMKRLGGCNQKEVLEYAKKLLAHEQKWFAMHGADFAAAKAN